MTDQPRSRSFDERFGIEIGIEEAQRRFISRISNTVFDSLISHDMVDHDASRSGSTSTRRASARRTANLHEGLYRSVSNTLGERRQDMPNLDQYVGNDFLRCLRVLEALYTALINSEFSEFAEVLSERINAAISASEIDLGVSWRPPAFVATGARLLDDRLVYDPLHWLDAPKYKTVYDPYWKGLAYFLESERKPQVLADVITDMYEALEALAQIITGRTGKTLSANREPFISRVGASDPYKTLLKEYVDYAHGFRHAAREPGARPTPSRAEVESFVYLTGIFIRLAIQQSD